MNSNHDRQFLLSFCIPTYNRPKQLARLLAELVPQLTPEVEVVIRDDSPNTLSEDVVKKELVARGVSLRYIRGERIGLDLANLFLLEKARGVYIWWFSDDDELAPGAIARVLGLVKKYPDIAFMWANFAYDKGRKLAVSLPEERFFRDRDELLELLGTNIGLLSTFIMKREEGLPFLELGRRNSIGFAFASLVPVLGSLTGSGRFFFLRGPYVLCNPTPVEEIKEIATHTGEIMNNGFDVYGVNFYNIVTLFKGKFKRSSMRKLLADNFAAVWRGILVGWVGGWDTPRGKRWRMLRLYWSYPECWVAFPVMLLPLPIVRGFYRFYKLFFNERKWRWGRKEQAITPTS